MGHALSLEFLECALATESCDYLRLDLSFKILLMSVLNCAESSELRKNSPFSASRKCFQSFHHRSVVLRNIQD